jgi:hypothetical protein
MFDELLIALEDVVLTINGNDCQGRESRIIQITPTVTITPANAQITVTTCVNVDWLRIAGPATGEDASTNFEASAPFRSICHTII